MHMKYQALFSSKDKSKTLKCRLLQVLFGALRVNSVENLLFIILQTIWSFDSIYDLLCLVLLL